MILVKREDCIPQYSGLSLWTVRTRVILQLFDTGFIHTQTLALTCTRVVASDLLFSQKRAVFFFVAPGSSPDDAKSIASVCVQGKFLSMKRYWLSMLSFLSPTTTGFSDDRFLLRLWTLALQGAHQVRLFLT